MICNLVDNEDGEEQRTTGRRKSPHPFTPSAGGSSFHTGGGQTTSVSGMEDSVGQMEFDFGEFPGEQEAHEGWLTSSGKTSLNGWAKQVMSRSSLEGND